MEKRKFALLEKAYSAEINGALNGTPWVMQTRSKLAKELVEEGLLDEVKVSYYGVTIEGFELTHAGRMFYCESSVNN